MRKTRKAHRKRHLAELERKALVGVIGAIVFILVVVVIALYLGLNEHRQ